MIKKVEMHVSEHTLDEDDGPGAQSIDINIYVQGLGATPTEKVLIREIMNMAEALIKTSLKDI